jgi:hypothetical protein
MLTERAAGVCDWDHKYTLSPHFLSRGTLIYT